jgi:Flp pilus assembly protein TadG
MWAAFRGDDRGSAPAEFVMVGALLVVLTLGVLQLALVVHVRNTTIDAAAEGARTASLAGSSINAGTDRTRELITAALSDGYAVDVSGRQTEVGGVELVEVTVRSPLPLIGLLGLSDGLEVSGRAPLEQLAAG